jgi:hypothetical protein
MPRDGSQIVIPYQRRFHNRGVLLHVSILMTIGDLAGDPILVVRRARVL